MWRSFVCQVVKTLILSTEGILCRGSSNYHNSHLQGPNISYHFPRSQLRKMSNRGYDVVVDVDEEVMLAPMFSQFMTSASHSFSSRATLVIPTSKKT